MVETPSKRYFQARNLVDLIQGYPMAKKNTRPEEVEREVKSREIFIDFLNGLLRLNPLERWSPQQAKKHPFVTGVAWNGPFAPPMEFKPRKAGSVTATSTTVSPSATTTQTTPSTRRPRATTIGAIKVGNIPPQLQQIAAMNTRMVQEQQQQQQQPPASSFVYTQQPVHPSTFAEYQRELHEGVQHGLSQMSLGNRIPFACRRLI